MLRVADDVIAMHGLLWPDEIRAPEGVAPEAGVKVRDAELDLADALMNTLGDADMDTLHDDYREAVEELVAAKAAGEPVAEEEAEEPEGKVIDLMAALESSVRAAKESHGEEGADGGHGGEVADVHPIGKKKTGASAKKSAPDKAAGQKKTAAKKAPAEKATKSAPAKKTAARRAASEKAETKKPAAKKTAAKKSAAKRSAAKKTSGGTRKRTSA